MLRINFIPGSQPKLKLIKKGGVWPWVSQIEDADRRMGSKNSGARKEERGDETSPKNEKAER
jgi:hypothetical protein